MTRFSRWFQLAAGATFLGYMLQFPGVGCGGKLLRNVNPCGTILNCDPLEYDLAFNDHYPNYGADPTCTIPGFCGGTPFPATGDGVIASPGRDAGSGTGVTFTPTGTTNGNTTGQ